MDCPATQKYIEQEANLREAGTDPSEMLNLMDPSPRLFARFALGDVSVPEDHSLELPEEVSISSFLQIVVPRLWWRRQELQESIETTSGLLSRSYGETAHRFDNWAQEMDKLGFALPFTMEEVKRTDQQLPLMRQLPVAADSLRSLTARTVLVSRHIVAHMISCTTS